MSLTLNTSIGPIKIELFIDECPEACENFLKLAASGYYENIPFHRILPSYIIQSGDPTHTGNGGSSIVGTPITVAPYGDFKQPGYIAYAEVEEVGSQFFITAVPTPELSGKYTSFGHVIFGLNNVLAISRMPTLEDHIPVRPVMLKNIIIHANPLAG